MICIELAEVNYQILDGPDGSKALMFMCPTSNIIVRVPFDKPGFDRFSGKVAAGAAGLQIAAPVVDVSAIKRR